MEAALYDDRNGYYNGRREGPETGVDFATSVTISPVFSYSIAQLANEFLNRFDDEVCSIVDIGCGDGELIRSVARFCRMTAPMARFFGVDRALRNRVADKNVIFCRSLGSIPDSGPTFLFSNELFDALPVHRVVQTGRGLEELGVEQDEGVPGWSQRPAPEALSRYLAERGVELEVGQIADFTPEWAAFYSAMLLRFEQALAVTIDYGFDGAKLFDARVRPTGTVAAVRGHSISRDLLAEPGSSDLTAHVNFSDLQTTGEEAGYTTLLWTRQARFLLSIGALDHPLLKPLDDDARLPLSDSLEVRDARAAARSLLLPAGIGDEMRVLVQARNVPMSGWSFQSQL